MTAGNWAADWQRRLRSVGQQTQHDFSEAVGYMDRQVVPRIRRTGLEAVRTAARELHRIAAALESAASPGRDR